MSTFVLIHGAWHGGWCWDKVVPLLEAQGHTVVAPDLQALGDDQTPVERVTLATWCDAIAKIVESLHGPVVLVGHSRAGIVISEVAERIPTKIAKLVYVTAFVCRDGESVLAIAQTDTEAMIGPFLAPSEDGLTMSLLDEGLEPVFYGDCLADVVTRAKSLLRPEPMIGLTTPAHVTAKNFGSVPRTYIFCENDRAIGLSTQRRMTQSFSFEKTISLSSSHSPFLSMPSELVHALIALAG